METHSCTVQCHKQPSCVSSRGLSRGLALKQHNIAIVWLRDPITGSLVQQHLTKPDAEIIKQSITLNKWSVSRWCAANYWIIYKKNWYFVENCLKNINDKIYYFCIIILLLLLLLLQALQLYSIDYLPLHVYANISKMKIKGVQSPAWMAHFISDIQLL